jgi:Tfp pilus assembly protein PilF
LGLAYFQQQNYAEAARNLSRAVDLGVNEAVIYNFLGISYSRTNQVAKAAASYKQALKLDPKLAEAHLNLAYAQQKMGQAKAAQKEYQTACTLEEKYCRFVPGAAQWTGAGLLNLFGFSRRCSACSTARAFAQGIVGLALKILSSVRRQLTAAETSSSADGP